MAQNENDDSTLLANSSTNRLHNTISEETVSGEDTNHLLSNSEVNSTIDSSNNSNDALNEEEAEDPLNQHRSAASETCLQSVIPDYPILTEENNSTGREIYNIAPGENKHPVSSMTDKLCEELAFPVLFPKGRFGYTAERQIKLSPVKYFNARLLHYSGRFEKTQNIFFLPSILLNRKKYLTV